MGTYLSYVWRSIMERKNLLEKGTRWRVGNGERINIWNHKWLPDQNGFKTWSMPKIMETNAIVASLIHTNTGEWKSKLVKNVFIPHGAEMILNIPLSKR